MNRKFKKNIKKIFERIGINPTIVLQFKYGNALKTQQKLCSNPNFIFDVGAFDGRTAIQYRKFFPFSKIYSFEPTDDSFKVLTKNIGGYNNVFPFQIAISDRCGTEQLFINQSGLTNSLLKSDPQYTDLIKGMTNQNSVLIQCDTIDNFCMRNHIEAIDILKIDVQGAEMKVLEGATEMLKAKKIGLIFLEVEYVKLYKNQPLFHDISTFLERIGYDLFSLYNLSFDNRNGQLLYSDALFVVKKGDWYNV